MPPFFLILAAATLLIARVAAAADFRVVDATPEEDAVTFQLENAPHGLKLAVRYELPAEDFYLRKRLSLTAARPIVLESTTGCRWPDRNTCSSWKIGWWSSRVRGSGSSSSTACLAT